MYLICVFDKENSGQFVKSNNSFVKPSKPEYSKSKKQILLFLTTEFLKPKSEGEIIILSLLKNFFFLRIFFF